MLFFTFLTLIASIVLAGVGALDPQDPNAKGGYFVYSQGDLEYVVGINAVDNGDVYIHMSAPEDKQWMGVGFGSRMQGAFMMVSHRASNSTGVNTSPRIADGHSEPSYDSSHVFEKIFSDAYAPFANSVANGIMIMHGVCRNCTTWSSGSLDLNSTTQPFIFAVGPVKSLKSNSAAADLSRHELYGQFTMDMTQATSTGSGRVPGPNIPNAGTGDNAFTSTHTSEGHDVNHDHDFGPPLHGLMMCAAFVLVFPFGALVLRLVKRVTWHAGVQVFGIALTIIGFGSAIYMSREYNRSKNFNSAHQVIGLLIFACLFIQLGLGYFHHATFKRAKRPTIMGRVHVFFGPGIVLLALINGGIGFNFAQDSGSNVPYAIVVVVVAVLFAGARAFLHFCSGPRKYKPERSPQFPEHPATPWSATPLYNFQSQGYHSPESGAPAPYTSHFAESGAPTPYTSQFPQYGSAEREEQPHPDESPIQTFSRSWKTFASSGF